MKKIFTVLVLILTLGAHSQSIKKIDSTKIIIIKVIGLKKGSTKIKATEEYIDSKKFKAIRKRLLTKARKQCFQK